MTRMVFQNSLKTIKKTFAPKMLQDALASFLSDAAARFN